MTVLKISEISTDNLFREVAARPYDTYVEALRRQSHYIALAHKTKGGDQTKHLAAWDHCTKAIRAYYALSRAAA